MRNLHINMWVGLAVFCLWMAGVTITSIVEKEPEDA